MDNEFKIDKETAEIDFNRFLTKWDIDADTDDMDKDDLKDFKGLKKKIVRSMQKGNLVLQDDELGSFKYTLHVPVNNVTELPIKRPGGVAYISMDRHREGQGVHKTFGVIGDMIKQPEKFVSSLDGIDLKLLLAISTLFLAS